MAEPQDAIVPILKNIQERMFAFERRTDASLADLKESVLDQSEKVDGMHGLMRYHLGMTTENQHQIAEIQKQSRDMQPRLSVLEGSSS